MYSRWIFGVWAVLELETGCGRIGFGDGASGDGAPSADAGRCLIVPESRVTNAAGQSDRGVLVWNGAGYAIAWNDNRDGNREIYVAILDATGAPLTGEQRITNTAATSSWPSIGWSGSSYGVMWAEASSEMMFQELDATGMPMTPAQVISTLGGGYVPSRAQRWIGDRYAVAWQMDAGSGDEIWYTELSANGTPLMAVARVTTDAVSAAFPTLAWTGTELGIAWSDRRTGEDEIYVARLATGALRLGPDVQLSGGANVSFYPTIEWTGTRYGVSWWDNRSGTAEMYIGMLDATGTPVGGELPIDPGNYGQAGLMRWSGREFGALWAAFPNNIIEPYFARLDGTGARLGAPLRVSSGGAEMALESGDLAWGGDRFAIAWSDARTGDVEVYLGFAQCP